MFDKLKIFVSTCHKYACGDASGEWIDLYNHSNLQDFEEAARAIHADEEDPELDFLDIDDSSNWPFRETKLSLNLIEQFIFFINLPEDEQQQLADYMEYQEANSDNLAELKKWHQKAINDHVGQYSSWNDFIWNEAENWLACLGIRDEDARREVINRMNLSSYGEELEQEYHYGSNGYVFIK